MSFPDDSRLQKVRIQLNLQIPDGCSQNTVYYSLRQRLIESFKTVPLFQVYFIGLGTQLWTMWTLDAKMDHGAPCVKKTLCKKIQVPYPAGFCRNIDTDCLHSKPGLIQQAQPTDNWWKAQETPSHVHCPGVPQHYWGLMSDGYELPNFSANYADAFFWSQRWYCFRWRRPVGGSCSRNCSGRCCDSCLRLPCRGPRGAVPRHGSSSG